MYSKWRKTPHISIQTLSRPALSDFSHRITNYENNVQKAIDNNSTNITI